MKEQEVSDLVERIWKETKVFGSPPFVWESKLNAVKYVLKTWVKVSYKDPREGDKRLNMI